MKLGITMLILNKDDIEFVTEFLCFLGHPVKYYKMMFKNNPAWKKVDIEVVMIFPRLLGHPVSNS